jgi:6-pyruvoyltetrahydropterin/6-carboxytetrahydropterin synthase
MKLTRRYEFSASHRLDTPALTADANRELYGKCNNPFGHGHNYVLDVTVAGAPDESGQIASREALDALVRERVLLRYDHRNLNADIAELKGVVPTTENIAVAIESALNDGWPLSARLDRIRIAETERNIFELEAKR